MNAGRSGLYARVGAASPRGGERATTVTSRGMRVEGRGNETNRRESGERKRESRWRGTFEKERTNDDEQPRALHVGGGRRRTAEDDGGPRGRGQREARVTETRIERVDERALG